MQCRMRPALSVVPVFLFLPAAALRAQVPSVLYEVQEGSTLTDECADCLRPTLQHAITGSLVLQRRLVPMPGEYYEISNLELSCASCGEGARYSISGGGSLHRQDLETQAATLELKVNEASGVVLTSGSVSALAPWPMVDVEVSEDGTRDPSQKLTLRIIAAPKVEMVPYELVKGSLEDRSGSLLEVICPPCRVLHPLVPLEGTLLAGLVDPVDDGLSTYRLDRIHLASLLPEAEFTILGSGSYQEGGDAEILKRMRLTVAINSLDGRDFLSGLVPVQPGAAFPVLDMEVEEVERNSLWYRLHLVARPARAYFFRRGDANADGRVDIADPIYHLLWRFSGGPPPSCREAADADGDGSHNLADAIFALRYLFLGGPEPPEPGPNECGPTPEARFSCEGYPACSARV